MEPFQPYKAKAGRQCWRAALAVVALVGALLAIPAAAQFPDFPYAYIYGVRIDSDVAGPTKALRGDGFPDVSVKLYLNNIPFWTGNPYNNSVTLRFLKLYNKSLPGVGWDTIPNSSAPPLIAKWNGKIVNRYDGGIDGLTLPNFSLLELFVNDSGPLKAHRSGFVLEIATYNGVYYLDVDPFDLKDRSLF